MGSNEKERQYTDIKNNNEDNESNTEVSVEIPQDNLVHEGNCKYKTKVSQGSRNGNLNDLQSEKIKDDKDREILRNSVVNREDDLQVKRALKSISNYSNCIRNFIGLNSEENLDENSDTESAMDDLSISKDFSTRHNSDINRVISKPNKSFRNIPEGHNLSDGENEETKNNEETNKRLHTMRQYLQNKEDENESHALPNQSNVSTNSKECIAQEKSDSVMDIQKNPNKNILLRENEEKNILKSSPKIESSGKMGIDNTDFYEIDDVHNEKDLTEGTPKDKSLNNSTDLALAVISVSDMDPDTICGLGSFKPQWLQKYATAKCYLVLFSIIGILQGSYYTYLIGIISTLEKRYAFKSKISGTMMMLDEITPMLLGIVVGYIGGRSHRPRIVAFGMFMSCVCCLISALPYFMYGTSQQLIASHVKNSTGTEYCDLQEKSEQCSTDDRPPTFVAVACLFIGSFFKGFGNLAYYAVGMSYMDDNAKKKNTPIYFGTVFGLRMLGPVIGFLMSSAFLRYYENPLSDPGYGQEDPRWIGAWWVGFILQAVLLVIFSFPILFFPRRLPKQRLRAFSNTKNFDIESNVQRMKGLLVAVKRLLNNPVYMCFTFGTIFSIIAGYGYYMMLPKYLQIQFQVSASDASLLTGPPCITASQVMTIIGAIGIYKFKPKAKLLISCQAVTEVIWIIGCFVLMWPSCQTSTITGTTITSDGSIELYNDCNSACSCSQAVYNPVCGSDGVSNYFSPCHAGCTFNGSSNSTLEECSCVLNNTGHFVMDSVQRGLCSGENCWNMAVIYVTILSILSGIFGTFRVAHTMIILRCIEPQDKSLALGLFETLLCSFAFIPLPIIFGALADASCLIWEKTCGEVGNCWIYDVDKFNYLLHGMSIVFTVLALICYFIVIFFSNIVNDLYEDDEFEFNSKPTTDSGNTNTKS